MNLQQYYREFNLSENFYSVTRLKWHVSGTKFTRKAGWTDALNLPTHNSLNMWAILGACVHARNTRQAYRSLRSINHENDFNFCTISTLRQECTEIQAAKDEIKEVSRLVKVEGKWNSTGRRHLHTNSKNKQFCLYEATYLNL